MRPEPTRRLRPAAVDTLDLLAEYDGVIFTLDDLARAEVECPVSGDDIARVTYRAI